MSTRNAEEERAFKAAWARDERARDPEKVRARRQAWRDNNREKVREQGREQAKIYRQRHPEKSKARDKVKKAVRSGRLVRQSCEVCGDLDTQAHHDDYSEPLEVRWLCKFHHVQEHKK